MLSRPAGGTRDLVGLDARLWPLLEGLELWGDGPREPVAGFKGGQIIALAMPRILSEADKDPAPSRPLPGRVPFLQAVEEVGEEDHEALAKLADMGNARSPRGRRVKR